MAEQAAVCETKPWLSSAVILADISLLFNDGMQSWHKQMVPNWLVEPGQHGKYSDLATAWMIQGSNPGRPTDFPILQRPPSLLFYMYQMLSTEGKLAKVGKRLLVSI